jgi:hypothetical protein
MKLALDCDVGREVRCYYYFLNNLVMEATAPQSSYCGIGLFPPPPKKIFPVRYIPLSHTAILVVRLRFCRSKLGNRWLKTTTLVLFQTLSPALLPVDMRSTQQVVQEPVPSGGFQSGMSQYSLWALVRS